jgi:hypothetical protein
MMNTQTEEQLEQASAPKSFEVVVVPKMLLTLKEMVTWCSINTDGFEFSVLDSLVSERGKAKSHELCQKFLNEFNKPNQRNVGLLNLRILFSFESELDALAFKLTWSEYL